MAKIELTISPNYQRNWNLWHGIRELVANGYDAEVEHNAPCVVTWHNNTLRIENEGVTLPRETLLMGHSSKMDRGDTVGQFGEGLKIGILALIRLGVEVKIRTGSEVWVPAIARSEKFNSDVMVFDIQGNRKPENRVRVEISGIDKPNYDLICSRFLRLSKIADEKVISTHYGDLLLGEENRGKIYVKGVYIKTMTEAQYGYNFKSATLNRDRDLIENLDYQMKNIWEEAIHTRPDLFEDFFKMLEAGAKDVGYITQYSAPYLSDSLKQLVTDKFVDRFGDKAIPVGSMADSQEAEHLNRKGVNVSATLLAILGEKLDTLEEVKLALKDEVTARYSWSDLTEQEKTAWKAALDMMTRITGDSNFRNCIEVVSFRSPTILGLYRADGRVYIAKHKLSSEATTLATIIHEYAHGITGKGDNQEGHTGAIEELWERVYCAMKDANWVAPKGE
jgi:hypothetical protein